MSLTLYVPRPGGVHTGGGNPVDPKRCRVRVSGQWHVHQCQGGALYDAVVDGEAVKVCGVHNPAKVAARKAASEAKYEAERKRADRHHKRPGEYRAALQKIADGDNDPRAIARAALDRWDDYQEPGE